MRLYLHYGSCHPQHTFKSIVYSQALQGIMINSREEWNIEYLVELRNKFLEQGYPLKLINGEFKRALEIDRQDLLFSTVKKKQKKNVVAPLIITYSPANPNFRKWISDEISVLHEDPKLRKTLPKIDVVTRQAENIQKKVIKSRHWRGRSEPFPAPSPGNFKLHQRNCVTCRRIEDAKTKYRSSKTGREYNITRHYTCESTHICT